MRSVQREYTQRVQGGARRGGAGQGDVGCEEGGGSIYSTSSSSSDSEEWMPSTKPTLRVAASSDSLSRRVRMLLSGSPAGQGGKLRCSPPT